VISIRDKPQRYEIQPLEKDSSNILTGYLRQFKLDLRLGYPPDWNKENRGDYY
jgi:hypothetical protein